ILPMLVAVALAIAVVVAMFTTQRSTAPNARNRERGLEESVNRFQDNVDKSFHRAFGDTL
ncbi:MAG TPA: hypothetical protein VM492_14810, partial [Sumerlaeia bacterium]|nr:hypothetical protein [Sumerlaeia bacterium]